MGADDQSAHVPVTIQAGSISEEVGEIRSPSDLPDLLRKVADEIENGMIVAR